MVIRFQSPERQSRASHAVRVFAIAAALAVPVATGGQSPSAPPAKPNIPRTADGRPNLQGMWSFATITPLERPERLAGQEYLSSEEATQQEQQFARSRSAPAAPPRPSASGETGAYNSFWTDFGTRVVKTKRTSLVVDPPDGKLPPMTPAGQQRVAHVIDLMKRAAGPDDRMLFERCLLGFNSGPPMIPSGYNNNVQIFQTSEHVALFNEMVHDTRLVPLDGRPHTKLRLWAGDSRGRWDGDTLVVETVNYRAAPTGNITIPPGGTDMSGFRLTSTSDENLRVIERFTLVDRETLLYEFTVEDPTVWTKPWTVALPMSKSDERIYEYACHEGNYGLRGILAGARATENANPQPNR